MDSVKLRPIVELISRLEAIDIEISKIDRFAMMAAENEIKARVALTLLDVTKMNQDNDSESKKHPLLVELEESGLQSQFMGIAALIDMSQKHQDSWRRQHNEKVNTSELLATLSENAVLSILGIILGEKHKERAELITQLKAHGIH